MGGVLSSFALIVAMAVMVSSFRISVDDWLTHLLSADVYVRVTSSGGTGGLGPTDQAALSRLPDVAQVVFTRSSRLTLDATRPPVTLLATDVNRQDPAARMQMTGAVLPSSALGPNDIPIWASEAMVDLYGYQIGKHVTLPIAGTQSATAMGSQQKPGDFVVAGIWRDYVRQTGAIVMERSVYNRLSGDTAADDIAITLRHNTHRDLFLAALNTLPFSSVLTVTLPDAIRSQTLTIFDRSFAVTYLLEAVAIVIGLFGVSATFSAQTLARAREFGMLRHIGVTRWQVLAELAMEGALLTGVGLAMGGVLGFAISLILVFVVNPQSFHWSMSLHMPWVTLCTVALTMMISSSATALLSGRKAIATQAIRAVKEDW